MKRWGMKRVATAIMWGCTAIGVCAGVTGAAADEVHVVDQTDVFLRGGDEYDTFRIPSVIVTPGGELLAIAEGRRDGRGDAGDIDLVGRRSSNGGRTWSAPVVIRDDGVNTCGNPCPVVDPETRTILLLSTHNLGHDREPSIIAGSSDGTRSVWIQRSTDDGRTFSVAEDITAVVKDPAWTWYATGPGAGIRLERGAHAGRLIVPCDHIEAGSRRYFSHVVWSDDHGRTWHRGGSSPRDQVNECEVMERADGSLILNMRNYDRSHRTRQVCVSADGGATWTDQRHDDVLVEPICQGSLRRIAWPDGDTPGLVAFSNPASAEGRRNMTVRLSRDEGETWPEAVVLHEGSSAYSCLVALPDGDIGCLYEADDYGRIVFARLARDDEGRSDGPG